jgi:hypothetical protein
VKFTNRAVVLAAAAAATAANVAVAILYRGQQRLAPGLEMMETAKQAPGKADDFRRFNSGNEW